MKVLSAVLVLCVVGGALSWSAEKFQDQILQWQNNYRSREGGSKMWRLEWDQSLANNADQWMQNCNFGYGNDNYGENYAFYYGSNDVNNMQQAFNDWYNEREFYNYNNNNMCGYSCRYTQMVWYNSRRVGCAVNYCPTLSAYNQEFNNAWFFGCWYDPKGNYGNEFPYYEGESCSECMGDGYGCDNGLCYEMNMEGNQMDMQMDSMNMNNNWGMNNNMNMNEMNMNMNNGNNFGMNKMNMNEMNMNNGNNWGMNNMNMDSMNMNNGNNFGMNNMNMNEMNMNNGNNWGMNNMNMDSMNMNNNNNWGMNNMNMNNNNNWGMNNMNEMEMNTNNNNFGMNNNMNMNEMEMNSNNNNFGMNNNMNEMEMNSNNNNFGMNNNMNMNEMEMNSNGNNFGMNNNMNEMEMNSNNNNFGMNNNMNEMEMNSNNNNFGMNNNMNEMEMNSNNNNFGMNNNMNMNEMEMNNNWNGNWGMNNNWNNWEMNNWGMDSNNWDWSNWNNWNMEMNNWNYWERDGRCYDWFKSGCAAYYNNGDCQNYPFYMRRYCRQSCGWCNGSNGEWGNNGFYNYNNDNWDMSGSCEDRYESCQSYFYGSCQNNMWMRNNCMKTCGFCDWQQ